MIDNAKQEIIVEYNMIYCRIWANHTSSPIQTTPESTTKGNDAHWRSHFGSNIVEELYPPRVVAKSEEMNASLPLHFIGWQT